MNYQPLLRQLYQDFNARQVDAVLAHMHADVQWPKAFEGGYVRGHDQIREYWTRQWLEINPTVQPIGFNQRADGKIEVTVHQLVKDLQGKPIFDGTVKHIYTLQDDLLQKMDIELV